MPRLWLAREQARNWNRPTMERVTHLEIRYWHIFRRTNQLRCRSWPAHVLFSPESFAQTPRRSHHICEREGLILKDVVTHHAALRESNGQGRNGTSCSRIIDEPVNTEASYAIDVLAGL